MKGTKLKQFHWYTCIHSWIETHMRFGRDGGGVHGIRFAVKEKENRGKRDKGSDEV